MSINSVCYIEFISRHLKVFLELCKLLCTKSLTVNLACSCIGSTETDFGCNLDKCGLCGLCLCFIDSCSDNINVVAVCNGESLPTVSFKTCTYIFCECNVCAAFDCDGV